MHAFISKNRVIGIVLGLLAAAILAVSIVSIVYAAKIYPGVKVNGVSVGGSSKETIAKTLETQTSEYRTELLPIEYGNTAIRLPLGQMGVTYNETAMQEAMDYGRKGNFLRQAGDRLILIFGKSVNFSSVKLNDAKLKPYLDQIEEGVNQPASNAQLEFSAGSVGVTPSSSGKRLDRGQLVLLIKDSIATMETKPINAPVYDLEPAITEETLGAAKQLADNYVVAPVKVEAQGKSQEIDLPTIVSWINVGQKTAQTELREGISNFYQAGNSDVVVAIDHGKVAGYVATFATKVDQKGQDAALTINEGRATVFRPSRDGIELLQPQAVSDIVAALTMPAAERKLALKTKLTKPAVNEANLNDLGIKELISEGISYFPGSSSARLTNVRVGQALYNGLLIKPDEVFSFGEHLGEVGAAQGYQPSLIIIGNKEEKQYGGGLCQVSSTLYRAALLAGLPIVQRTNHSFAINEFYTKPFPAPGVDATIYYPQVDLKFKNDTGSHILIQTVMQGTTLRFQMYGTKTKEGRIRGPFFTSGDMDATKPSKTVFYRDVLDLSGNVIKTDTTYTSYKASTDFTIVESKQFN